MVRVAGGLHPAEGGHPDPAPDNQELDRDGHPQLQGEEAVRGGALERAPAKAGPVEVGVQRLHRGREHGQAGCSPGHLHRHPAADRGRKVRWREGLLSGHGQEKITGKQLDTEALQKLVLWSWQEEEVANLLTRMSKKEGPELPSDDVYKVCGGSVRYLFRPEEDETRIREAVKGLSQDEMKKLLALEMTLDDQQGKNRSRLLSFFPLGKVSNAEDKSFADGIVSVQAVPRSDFVMKCIKENKHAKFEEVLKMYRELSGMNPGAAGSAFELLVHLFWREAAAKKQEVELSLKGKKIAKVAKVKVDCKQFEEKPA